MSAERVVLLRRIVECRVVRALFVEQHLAADDSV